MNPITSLSLKNLSQGLETRGAPGPQPQAADMQELVWDEGLQRKAQGWVDKCHWGTTLHNPDREAEGLGKTGENAASNTGQDAVSYGLTGWYNEVKDFNKDQVGWFTGLVRRST